MMQINKASMYDDNHACRMCGIVSDEGVAEHADDCPGAVIEGMEWEITYDADSCGCCRGVSGSDSSESLGQCVAEAARSVYGEKRVTAEARMVYRRDDIDARALIEAECERIHAQRQADDAAKQRAAVKARRSKSLADLEAQRGDLTPEAYERRRAAIEASAS